MKAFTLLRRKRRKRLHLVMDAWFVANVIRHLTRGRYEVLCYLAGPITPRRFISHLCALDFDAQSAVYVRANADSCARAQLETLRWGCRIQIAAHSHPGTGPLATQPSRIDWRDLTVQQVGFGADMVGMIVVSDGHIGYVRFFSPHVPFKVTMCGTRATKINEHLYRIAL